jgi:hypothetical protein
MKYRDTVTFKIFKNVFHFHSYIKKVFSLNVDYIFIRLQLKLFPLNTIVKTPLCT